MDWPRDARVRAVSLPIALLAVLFGFALGASIDGWFEKEGAREHIGRAVLGAIIVLFAIVAVRRRLALRPTWTAGGRLRLHRCAIHA